MATGTGARTGQEERIGMGVDTCRRTQDGNGDGSGDENKISSGDENRDEDGNGDGNEDGIGKSGEEAKKRKKSTRGIDTVRFFYCERHHLWRQGVVLTGTQQLSS